MNIFLKKFQFRMALFYPIFTMKTLTTVTTFLNLKSCFAEDNLTDPTPETLCVQRVNICKLLIAFLGTDWACLFDSIHSSDLIVIQLMDRYEWNEFDSTRQKYRC